MHKFITFIPFFYALHTRISTIRSFYIQCATQWIPGIGVIYYYRDGIFESIVEYGLGFACFIAVYEIGYLANDTLGLRFDEKPRKRLRHRYQPLDFIIFVGIRLIVFVVCAQYLEVLFRIEFVVVYLSLVAVMVAHNITWYSPLKLITFFQLSIFRFIAPVVPVLYGIQILNVTIVAILFNSLIRFLVYLDAKGRLNLPQRKTPLYLMIHYTALLPLSVSLYVISDDLIYIMFWIYYLILNWGQALMRRMTAFSMG